MPLASQGLSRFSLFFVASAFRPVWPGRCDLSFICIPQSTRALDQGGVEPRQAVSPKALRPWTIPLRYSVGWLSRFSLRDIGTLFPIWPTGIGMRFHSPGGGSLDARLPVKYTNRPGGGVEAVESSFCLGPL